MKTIRHFASIIALFVTTGAWADVGMITQLSGDASLTAEAGGKQTAVPFLKVNAGDKVLLSSGTLCCCSRVSLLVARVWQVTCTLPPCFNGSAM